MWGDGMIRIRFEYICDYCAREIVGADVHNHGADYGRYPVPRHVSKVGHAHACTDCVQVAMEAVRNSAAHDKAIA